MLWPIANNLEISLMGYQETIDMTNLILGQVARVSLWQDTPEVVFWGEGRELGGHCTQDGFFYMHQLLFVFIMVFGQ